MSSSVSGSTIGCITGLHAHLLLEEVQLLRDVRGALTGEVRPFGILAVAPHPVAGAADGCLGGAGIRLAARKGRLGFGGEGRGGKET